MRLLFNKNMSKTGKELAFLRDLYIAPDWTTRFTDIFDKNFKFGDEKEILYVNGGTGAHPLQLREKLGVDVRFQVYSEDEEANMLARGKAEMLGTKIEFSDEFPRESYDLVIADATFVGPEELSEFIGEIIELSDARVAFILPTAGSFGEMFSVLWESFLNADLLENAPEVERLITTVPQISKVEAIAENLGLLQVKSVTENEIFEFANGTEFIESPLVADFLLPAWLGFLNDEEMERACAALTQIIDESAENLTFRFTVKATLITGEKSQSDKAER